jgi:preprotein translocase subunit SecF
MRIFGNAHYSFLESRKKAYVFSSVLILAGIAAMLVNTLTIGSWQNYGVDFEGGSFIQVRFSIPMTAAQLRSELAGGGGVEITRFGEENEFVIRSPLTDDASLETTSDAIRSRLEAAFGAGNLEVVRTEVVGPKVGGELQQKAGMAILFSFVLTLVYLAFRFELRFGVAAVIATAHDILITLGLMALMRMEIALPSVAALLTVVGYSLNDTIIIFDRIRENLGKRGGRKEEPIVLLNRSINETLPRTILTAGTTLAVLVALLALGGPVIRDFTLVLILGIFFGTYSSIFVASPALLEIQKRFGTGEDKERRKRRPASATA